MSINEKLKSIAESLVMQVVDAVHEELVRVLKQELQQLQEAQPGAPVRVAVARKEIELAKKKVKSCRQQGCINVPVPRFRNYCAAHKELAAAAAPPKKRGRRKKAKKAE